MKGFLGYAMHSGFSGPSEGAAGELASILELSHTAGAGTGVRDVAVQEVDRFGGRWHQIEGVCG